MTAFSACVFIFACIHWLAPQLWLIEEGCGCRRGWILRLAMLIFHGAFGQSCSVVDTAEWDLSLWLLFSHQNLTPLLKRQNQGKACWGIARGRQEGAWERSSFVRCHMNWTVGLGPLIYVIIATGLSKKWSGDKVLSGVLLLGASSKGQFLLSHLF